ncbi:MAG TPA: hypothetical protein VII69_03275 [Candidatus Eremiobacteraceae bacterium]
MQITIAEQRVLRFEPAFSAAEARGRAMAHKAAAFGTLSRLFSRPKDDEVVLEESGMRYEPLWHARAHLHFVYDRRETYRISPKGQYVKSITIGVDAYSIDSTKQNAVDIRAVEHCERDERKELWLDAVTNKAVDSQSYAKANGVDIELGALASDGSRIVEPTVRASGAIRTLLGDDFRPTEADNVQDETIEVECIDLCLRPAYGYKYVWAAKNKTAEIAIDGVTGEIRSESSNSLSAVGKLLQPETLFDIGAETLNLVVPGGAIVLKVARAIADKRG